MRHVKTVSSSLAVGTFAFRRCADGDLLATGGVKIAARISEKGFVRCVLSPIFAIFACLNRRLLLA